jgi:hypothetical protein
VIRIAERSPDASRLHARLPDAALTLAGDGQLGAVLGILRGLSAGAHAAKAVAAAIATPAMVALILDELDAESAGLDGRALADAATSVAMLVELRPAEAWACLERSESARMQRLLLDALAGTGAGVLDLVKSKLGSTNAVVARHAVALLPRLGGTARDLAVAARHPNEAVRLEVMRALRGLPPDQAAMDLVADNLADEAADVRKAARLMLRGEFLGPRAIAVVHAVANDGEQPIELRERLVEVLAHSLRDEGADALFELVHPKSLLELGTLRELAASALRRSKAPKAATLFEEGLRSPVRRVRKACERAAGTG